jgi:hypothetical protein
MPLYRIYLLASAARVAGPQIEIRARDDSAALEAARAHVQAEVNSMAAEVWQGARQVGSIPAGRP